MKKRARRTAVNSADKLSISASDVFKRIDERFNKQEEHSESITKEMRAEIRALGDKIDAQIHTFDKQLSKLNDNMDAVLRRISDHEQRLVKLETDRQESAQRKKAWTKVIETLSTGFHGVMYVLMALGAAYGIKPCLKLFGLMSP